MVKPVVELVNEVLKNGLLEDPFVERVGSDEAVLYGDVDFGNGKERLKLELKEVVSIYATVSFGFIVGDKQYNITVKRPVESVDEVRDLLKLAYRLYLEALDQVCGEECGKRHG